MRLTQDGCFNYPGQLNLVRQVREREQPVILISHNLQHVSEVADRMVVLNRGRVSGAFATRETGVEEVVQLITSGMTARQMAERVAGRAGV